MPNHEQRTVILYVEEIDLRPKLPEPGKRITVIDIELNEHEAIQLIDELKTRLQSESFIGAIRVRFSGRLVLP